MPYEEALSGFERFEFAEAHYACPVYRKGGGGMGDSTTRFRIWGWRAASRTRAKRRKPERRFRTSSHCGRTPTPTFLFLSKLKRNTPSCGDRTDLRISVVYSERERILGGTAIDAYRLRGNSGRDRCQPWLREPEILF
jgi:hypothetical protein